MSLMPQNLTKSTVEEPINARPEKHVNLVHAINRINELEVRTQDILNRVINREMKAEGAEITKDGQPSLFEVLCDGPDAIHRKVERVHGLLDELVEALF